jgi:hypothetical protein
MMTSSANTYYIYRSYDDAPIPWDLSDATQNAAPDYFRRTLQVMDRHLGDHGLTFYLTWKLDELPAYGNDVVAVVLGDEWCRVPLYAQDVLATFKCYGTSLPLGLNTHHLFSSLNAVALAKHLRTQVYRLPGLSKHLTHRIKRHISGNQPAPPIFDVPLGYGNQVDLPITPVAERTVDLFFSGSVEHTSYPWWSPQHWLQNPKTRSRSAMLEQLQALQAQRPDLQIGLATASEFAWNAIYYSKEESHDMMDAETYSRHMVDTKICLVPRGTSLETFRFFEALRAGCVIISDPLPSRWFYDGSPAIILDDWQALPNLIDRVLDDPTLLETKHEAALDWWKNVCSEEAVGTYMARLLRDLI